MILKLKLEGYADVSSADHRSAHKEDNDKTPTNESLNKNVDDNPTSRPQDATSEDSRSNVWSEQKVDGGTQDDEETTSYAKSLVGCGMFDICEFYDPISIEVNTDDYKNIGSVLYFSIWYGIPNSYTISLAAYTNCLRQESASQFSSGTIPPHLLRLLKVLPPHLFLESCSLKGISSPSQRCLSFENFCRFIETVSQRVREEAEEVSEVIISLKLLSPCSIVEFASSESPNANAFLPSRDSSFMKQHAYQSVHDFTADKQLQLSALNVTTRQQQKSSLLNLISSNCSSSISLNPTFGAETSLATLPTASSSSIGFSFPQTYEGKKREQTESDPHELLHHHLHMLLAQPAVNLIAKTAKSSQQVEPIELRMVTLTSQTVDEICMLLSSIPTDLKRYPLVVCSLLGPSIIDMVVYKMRCKIDSSNLFSSLTDSELASCHEVAKSMAGASYHAILSIPESNRSEIQSSLLQKSLTLYNKCSKMESRDVLSILKEILTLDCGDDESNTKFRLKLFSSLIKSHWDTVVIDVLLHKLLQFSSEESQISSRSKTMELIPAVFNSYCEECHENLTACHIKMSTDHKMCWKCLTGSNITSFFSQRPYLLNNNHASILIANFSKSQICKPDTSTNMSEISSQCQTILRNTSDVVSNRTLIETANNKTSGDKTITNFVEKTPTTTNSCSTILEGIPASHLLAHQQNILEPESGTRFGQSSDGHKVIVSSSCMKWTINNMRNSNAGTPTVVLKQSGTGVHPQDKRIELSMNRN